MERTVEGLWLIWFEGAPGGGRGFMWLQDGNIEGGETAWYYRGTYETDQSGIDGSLTLTHYGKPTSRSSGGHTADQSPVEVRIRGQWIDGATIGAYAEPVDGGSRMDFQMRRPVATGP